MTREEIENLSTVEPAYFESDREERWYEIGCMDGLATADEEPNLESLWHDASEKPHAKEWLLVQLDKDDYKILCLKDLYIDLWCDWCKIFNFIRWAYIDDLLPKGGKK